MHEHLDEFDLINMNGRVYDPTVVQFLSPDPYIQDAGNWLNYNRYAYCYNNPTRYVDPSGEVIVALVLTFVFAQTNPIAPAFKQPGGGIQYKLEVPISYLIKEGKLIIIYHSK